MQENLIDRAVASSATYRDAKEEAKKKIKRGGEREREIEKREWSRRNRKDRRA